MTALPAGVLGIMNCVSARRILHIARWASDSSDGARAKGPSQGLGCMRSWLWTPSLVLLVVRTGMRNRLACTSRPPWQCCVSRAAYQ